MKSYTKVARTDTEKNISRKLNTLGQHEQHYSQYCFIHDDDDAELTERSFMKGITAVLRTYSKVPNKRRCTILKLNWLMKKSFLRSFEVI